MHGSRQRTSAAHRSSYLPWGLDTDLNPGAPSFGHGVAMTVRHLPLPAFSSIHLSHPQAIASRLTVDGGRGPLETGGIGHVARDVICLELELVRRAVGEATSQGGEELVQFMP